MGHINVSTAVALIVLSIVMSSTAWWLNAQAPDPD